jgi:hypothetical protein
MPMARRFRMTADTIGFSSSTPVSFSMMEAIVTTWCRERPISSARFSASGGTFLRNCLTMNSRISSGVTGFTKRYLSGKRYPSALSPGIPSRWSMAGEAAVARNTSSVTSLSSSSIFAMS